MRNLIKNLIKKYFRLPGVFPNPELHRVLRNLVGSLRGGDIIHHKPGRRRRGLARVHGSAEQLLRVHLDAAQSIHTGGHGRRK